MEFNETKYVFCLVSGVFCVYALAALSSTFVCLNNLSLQECAIVADGKLSEAFNTLLASALAFAAGRVSKSGS